MTRAPSMPVKAPIPEAADLGPKMLALPERERAFVWHLVCNGGNGTEAAIAAGYADVGAACRVRAHELRAKSRVVEAIHECGWRLLGGLGGPAIYALEQLVLRPEHPDHFKAVTAVLSRIGFHEKTGLDVRHSGVVELNRTDATLEALRYLKSLDVPREKLIEKFGYSGLARYEKMIEEQDAKQGMKVIDHAHDDGGEESLQSRVGEKAEKEKS